MSKTTLIGSLFLSFILLVGVVNAVTPPSGVGRYWAITLNNPTGSPTPHNFSQLINFNAYLNQSAYSGFQLANKLNNTEFFYANGTIIPSWLGGNLTNVDTVTNLNASTDIFYFVKIAPPFTGTYTIYYGLQASANDVIVGGLTGESPLISHSYGNRDNGAVVFPLFYSNFTGTSLNMGLWSNAGGLTLNQNDGITITANGNSNRLYAPSYLYNPQSNTIDAWWYIGSSGGNNAGVGFVTSDSGSSTMIYSQASAPLYQLDNGATPFSSPSNTRVNVFTVYQNSSNSNADTGLFNYGDYTTASSSGSTAASAGFYFYSGSNGYVQLIYVRATPPDGVMPTESWATTTSTTSTSSTTSSTTSTTSTSSTTSSTTSTTTSTTTISATTSVPNINYTSPYPQIQNAGNVSSIPQALSYTLVIGYPYPIAGLALAFLAFGIGAIRTRKIRIGLQWAFIFSILMLSISRTIGNAGLTVILLIFLVVASYFDTTKKH